MENLARGRAQAIPPLGGATLLQAALVIIVAGEEATHGGPVGPTRSGGGGRSVAPGIEDRIALYPGWFIAEKCAREMTLDEPARLRAQPKVMHENRAGQAAAEEAEGQFQRAEILRPVDQNDVAGTEKLREKKKRISETAVHIPALAQAFRGDWSVRRITVRFQTNDRYFRKESRQDQRTLGASPPGLDNPARLRGGDEGVEEVKLAPANALALVRQSVGCAEIAGEKPFRFA